MAPRSPHQRLQSDTRMDVLTLTMQGARTKGTETSSPHDSLSPCDEYFEQNAKDQESTIALDRQGNQIAIAISTPGQSPADGKRQLGLTSQAGPPGAQTQQRQQERPTPRLTFHTPTENNNTRPTPAHAASHTSPAAPACEPRFLLSRSHRPARLYIDHHNGLTTLPIDQLKQSIRQAAPLDAKSWTLEHKPLPSPLTRRRRRLPKSPPPPPPRSRAGSGASMGNQHSHHALGEESALDDSDSRSLRSVIRSPNGGKAIRIPRRSSINVFKRLDSKSPLPSDFAAMAIEVPRAATAPNLDNLADDDTTEYGSEEEERGRLRHVHRYSAPSPSIPVQPASPSATLTEESAARPLSASGTITDHDRRPQTDGQDDLTEEESPQHLRVSALSPTLPTPSPVPEDSPHKYGLKDRMETPEAPSPPPDINVVKARRRSSGLEIFNEAKTLQSASSFLNGLSTARRRAESRAQSRNATDNSGGTTIATAGTSTTYSYSSAYPSLSHLPLSAASSTTALHHPTSASHLHGHGNSTLNLLPTLPSQPTLAIDTTDRNRGHSTKSSGFAYARALNLTQLKCFRNHNHLLLSRNKNAPVECAVCHADDERDHWTCTWCALRMCGFCRRDFEGKGVLGLRERVRMAELGDQVDQSATEVVREAPSRAGGVGVKVYG